MTLRCIMCDEPFEAETTPVGRFIAICGGRCYRLLELNRGVLRRQLRSVTPTEKEREIMASTLRELL